MKRSRHFPPNTSCFHEYKDEKEHFFLAKHDTSYSNTKEVSTKESGDDQMVGNRFIATIDLSKQAGRFKSESGAHMI